MLPPRDQTAVGAKVTLMVQEDPAARVVMQLLVCVKSPLATTLFTVRLAVPELVIVIGFAALFLPTVTPLKLRLVTESVAAAPTPEPLREAVCGLPVALSEILKVAVRDPMTVGLKVTLTVQLLPASRVAVQVLVCEKLSL